MSPNQYCEGDRVSIGGSLGEYLVGGEREIGHRMPHPVAQFETGTSKRTARKTATDRDIFCAGRVLVV